MKKPKTLKVSSYSSEQEWDDFQQDLGEHIKQISAGPEWHIEGRNMGWMKRNGYKDIECKGSCVDSLAESFLRQILPHGEAYITATLHPTVIEMTVSHHDGNDFYLATPLNPKTPHPDELFYTPTEIGGKIGMTPHVFNKKLESLGFQKRLGDKWQPTDKGRNFSKQKSQWLVRWSLDILKEIENEN